MSGALKEYLPIVGERIIDQLLQVAGPLAGKRVVHVNSTRAGGGVAEILLKLDPLMNELGLQSSWEVIDGDPDFFECTKSFHNAIQGNQVIIPKNQFKHFEEINRENAKKLRPILEEADMVFIHDPQPVALIDHFADHANKWIWRCHIDASRPNRKVWNFIKQWIVKYDASVFTMPDFTHHLPHPTYLVAPSIDPLTPKNIELPEEEINSVCETFGIDRSRPMIVQVSRYDRFKDPIGVIESYQIAKKFVPGLQLVLAGGSAADDPEGEAVLHEVNQAADNDPDVKVLLLPSDAHRTINALQRASDIVVQKSLREGFGLTVTEGLWKGKPVIGGNVGGIRLQVKDYETGFVVNTPEGAALGIRYLLNHPEKRKKMGEDGRELVRQKFLITRHLREYMTLMLTMIHQCDERIQLDKLK